MSTKVVVELTSDEEKLLAAFRKAEVADEKLRAKLGLTGKEGETAAGKFAKAWIDGGNKGVGSVDRLVGEMRRSGDVGRSVGKDLDKYLSSIGAGGKRSIEQIIESISRLHPEAAEQAQKLLQEFKDSSDQATFTEAREALKSLGPAGEAAAKEISESLEKADQLSDFKISMSKLMKLGPEGEEQARQIREALEHTDKQVRFDAAMEQLRALGGDAAVIASQMGEELKQASNEAAGGLESVLAKIKEIRPEVAESADRIRAELNEAAKFGEGKFKQTLDVLRSMGPAGKAVAAEFRQAMVSEGKIIDQSIDGVIAKLDAVDPAAAKAARDINTRLSDAAQQSDDAFGTFGRSALHQLAAVAGAYIGIQEAIQATTRFLNEQEESLRSAAETQMSLAGAQQEALKNLAGLSAADRKGLLEGFVGEVAGKTGFADQKQLTLAVGAGVSAGGTVEQTKSAVEASARILRFDPESVDEFTAAAIDLARATGKDDAKANLSFLLSSGTQSRVVDPAQLAKNLAPAVVSSVQSVPRQNREQASAEAAALFGVFSKAATDTKGESTATALIQYANELQKFFQGKENDPGTLFGRISKLQNDQGLKSSFFEKEFGEQRFRGIFKAVTDKQSQWVKELTDSRRKISTDTGVFDRNAAESGSATFQIKSASLDQSFKASQTAGDIQNREGAALQQQRDLVADLLKRNRGDGGAGMFITSITDESFISKGRARGSTTAEEAVDLLDTIEARIQQLQRGGISEVERANIGDLRRGSNAIKKSLFDRAGDLTPGSFGRAADRAQAFAAEIQNVGGGRERVIANLNLAQQLRQASQDAQSEQVQLLKSQNEFLSRQAAAAERSADANERTERNTRRSRPGVTDAQRGAANRPPGGRR